MSLRSFFRVPTHVSGPNIVPRSSTSDHNPVIYPDSQDREFTMEYLPMSTGPWFAKQKYPGRLSGVEEKESYWNPPPHYHLLQDEHFKVENGEGLFLTYGGKSKLIKKGDEFVIPARRWHTFQRTAESMEDLVLLHRYDAEYAEMEERFFRNCFEYFTDCRRAGVEPSLFQVGVFLMYGWVPIGLPAFGPEWFNMILSTILTVILGCIGQFVLGYKKSYPEYYNEKSKKSN